MKATIFMAVALLSASIVKADLITFDVAWSGSSYGNSATAVGTVTFDDSLLPNPGSGGDFGTIPAFVSAVDITISGASDGNGNFTLAGFGGLAWSTGGATLDLNAELVGQPTLGPFAWGTPEEVSAGDFNLFGTGDLGSTAPVGSNEFVLTTFGGENMALTSFLSQSASAAVPEPSTWAFLTLAGIGFGGWQLKRRRAKKTA